jgi:hypothetical protein
MLSGAQKRAFSVLSEFIYKTIYGMGGKSFATKRTLDSLVKKGVLESRINKQGEEEWRIKT